MKSPICSFDAKSGVLCSKCEIKLQTGGITQDDVDASTIPQEAELEGDTVSFTKGCFLGQELVCRIDTRGHVNRFLRRLVPLDDTRPVPGAEVVAGEKVVGAVPSVTPDGVTPVALGYVRREVEPGAVVEVRWGTGSTEARVEPRRPVDA